MEDKKLEDLLAQAAAKGPAEGKLTQFCGVQKLVNAKRVGTLTEDEMQILLYAEQLLVQDRKDECRVLANYIGTQINFRYRHIVEEHATFAVDANGIVYEGINPNQEVIIDLNDPNQLRGSW